MLTSHFESEAEQLRVAVIGLGKMGLMHAGLAGALDDSRLVAIAESSRMLRTAAGSIFEDVEIVANHDVLIDPERVDLVVIATPPDTHAAIASECFDVGLPFFLEKPLAQNSESCAPLLALLESKPVVNMVGYMERYASTFEQAKTLLDQGTIGDVQSFRGTMYSSQLFGVGTGWRYDPRVSGGGALITQGCHLVDLLTWFFGQPSRTCGWTSAPYSESVEDSAHAMIEFEGGVAGHIDVSWSTRQHRKPSIDIRMEGSSGTIAVNGDSLQLFVDSEVGGVWTTSWPPDLFEGVPFDLGGEHYTRQMIDLLRAIRSGSNVRSTVATAARTQALIEAIYRSAAAGGEAVEMGDSVA